MDDSMGGSRRPERTSETPAATDDAVDFRALVESMSDIAYTLDLDGRLTYLSPRAYEVFGYTREEGQRFIGGSFLDILMPGSSAVAVAAVRHRVEFPRDRQLFRLEGRHKDGSGITMEIHGGPLVRDGQVVGRMGVCRVLADTGRDEAAAHVTVPQMLQEERMRIARGLRDAIAQVVFGITAEREASEAFLLDVKRATVADLARRLDLDDVDLAILRLIASGASNREIGAQVHLSPAAIKDRIRRFMERLGARRRSELAAHALRLGIA